MTCDIGAALRVLLSDDRANLSEDAESLRGVYVTPLVNPTSTKHRKCWVVIHTLIDKKRFEVYRRPMNKTVHVLLRLKADNILPKSELGHDIYNLILLRSRSSILALLRCKVNKLFDRSY